MKIPHYIKVASHFPPWRRTFWLGLLHDGVEDGWIGRAALSALPATFRADLLALSRASGQGYWDYIEELRLRGGDCILVKRADLVENYKRCWPSLRKRYAKAMLILYR